MTTPAKLCSTCRVAIVHPAETKCDSCLRLACEAIAYARDVRAQCEGTKTNTANLPPAPRCECCGLKKFTWLWRFPGQFGGPTGDKATLCHECIQLAKESRVAKVEVLCGVLKIRQDRERKAKPLMAVEVTNPRTIPWRKLFPDGSPIELPEGMEPTLILGADDEEAVTERCPAIVGQPGGDAFDALIKLADEQIALAVAGNSLEPADDDFGPCVFCGTPSVDGFDTGDDSVVFCEEHETRAWMVCDVLEDQVEHGGYGGLQAFHAADRRCAMLCQAIGEWLGVLSGNCTWQDAASGFEKLLSWIKKQNKGQDWR